MFWCQWMRARLSVCCVCEWARVWVWKFANSNLEINFSITLYFIWFFISRVPLYQPTYVPFPPSLSPPPPHLFNITYLSCISLVPRDVQFSRRITPQVSRQGPKQRIYNIKQQNTVPKKLFRILFWNIFVLYSPSPRWRPMGRSWDVAIPFYELLLLFLRVLVWREWNWIDDVDNEKQKQKYKRSRYDGETCCLLQYKLTADSLSIRSVCRWHYPESGNISELLPGTGRNRGKAGREFRPV